MAGVDLEDVTLEDQVQQVQWQIAGIHVHELAERCEPFWGDALGLVQRNGNAACHSWQVAIRLGQPPMNCTDKTSSTSVFCVVRAAPVAS